MFAHLKQDISLCGGKPGDCKAGEGGRLGEDTFH